MVVLNGSDIDVSKLEMADIIDREVLQKFLDNFALGFNCAAVSVGRDGEEFTRPSHYRPFCANYVHASDVGDARCAACHKEFGQQATARRRPYIAQCHAGLIDFAAPILVEGELIGTLLGGQILDKPADENKISRVASEIGVDQEGLVAASRKVDVVEMKTVEAAAEVLYVVSNALAQSGYNRIKTDVMAQGLANNFIQISSSVERLAQDAQSISGNQSALVEQIHDVGVNVKEIASVLKSITKIADQTRILGMNASIEAARFGVEGKAFAVVAEEIRNLADSTKATVSSIDTISEKVENSIQKTVDNANNTLETTSQQSASMEELSAAVQNTVGLAEMLHNLHS